MSVVEAGTESILLPSTQVNSCSASAERISGGIGGVHAEMEMANPNEIHATASFLNIFSLVELSEKWVA
jgi:hypothetical protein